MSYRKCGRCKGVGRVALASGALERACFVCMGGGIIAPPDIMELRALVIGIDQIRLHPPMIKHKLALAFVGKVGPWGHIPNTAEEVQNAWKATITGRRANYIWKRARQELGIIKTVYAVYAVEGTKHDPYQPELEQLIAELIAEFKK